MEFVMRKFLIPLLMASAMMPGAAGARDRDGTPDRVVQRAERNQEERSSAVTQRAAGGREDLVGLLLRQPRVTPRELLALERRVRDGVVVEQSGERLEHRRLARPGRAGDHDRADHV